MLPNLARPVGRHRMQHLGLYCLLALGAAPVAAQATSGTSIEIPLNADAWSATDSIRFDTHLGRPSLYINRGVALARGVHLTDGTYEFEMAATDRSNFLGAVFHARASDFAESVFFRFTQSGTPDAVQYGPAFRSLGAAWQLFRGPGATATAELPRGRWLPVRIELAAGMARVFLDGATEPVLQIPRLAGSGGTQLGIWTGLFGQGAWFSRLRYTAHPAATARAAAPVAPAGSLLTWELSEVLDAETLDPAVMPDLATRQWQSIQAEPDGLVLINRYRVAPMARLPLNPDTRSILVDSAMSGRVPGAKVVLARTVIDARAAGVRRMHFGYSDGVTIYVNGVPLFFGLNAQFFRGDGIISSGGDAVYLPLRQGRNEIVMAVTEYSGGWGFWARLDP